MYAASVAKVSQSAGILKVIWEHTLGRNHIIVINVKKAFSDNANLRSHLKTHSGERPYKYSQYDKAFITEYRTKKSY